MIRDARAEDAAPTGAEVAAGRTLIEVTSNAKLCGAHAFYERLGYERTSHRFAKQLRE